MHQENLVIFMTEQGPLPKEVEELIREERELDLYREWVRRGKYAGNGRDDTGNEKAVEEQVKKLDSETKRLDEDTKRIIKRLTDS